MSMNRIFAASRSALQTQKANAALFKSAMKPMAVKGKLLACADTTRDISLIHSLAYSTQAASAGQIR